MKQIYEFGDFRAHPAEQLLLRQGQPVALSPKVFETLVILLESDGRLIDKDDFIQQLWPGVFVEDVALAQNISHLRKVLGDGKNEAQMIQTVPKRGYRFAATVRRVADEPAAVAVVSPGVSGVSGGWVRSKKWMFAGIALLLLVAAGAYFFHSRDRKVLTKDDTVVLADFGNSTGDPVFDSALRQGLAVQLEQSPFLSLVTEERIRQVLRMMGKEPDAQLTPAVAREVCERNGSAAVLDGSIASLGSEYVLGLRATDCRSGRVLAEEQVQAARKEDVLNALDRIARRFRTRVGESLTTVEKYDTPLAEATTSSLEALKAYSLGSEQMSKGATTRALPFFQRAVELDPNFAAAYRSMSVVYRNLHAPEEAAENIRKAYELRQKVSERERLSIEAGYYQNGTGEMEKLVPVLESYEQTYPRDYVSHLSLGLLYRRIGQSEKAMEEHQEALRLAPNATVVYQNLGADYVNLNRLDDAEAIYKEAEKRKLGYEGRARSRYFLAFLKGDTAQMQQLVQEGMSKRSDEEGVLTAQADTASWYGRQREARELIRRATDFALRNGAKEAAASDLAGGTLFDAESGNREQVVAGTDAALKLAPNRDVKEMAAFSLARVGDTATAEKLAGELDKAFPVDTLVQRYWLPVIRASVALQHKDARRALEVLEAAKDFELSSPSLLPVYLRGEAYLMLHDGGAAATEFQKYIDHRGVVRNSPWGALARLGLGRAYAMQGDMQKARGAYQDFLTLWKDADPESAILKEAKVEYEKLRQS